MTKRIRIDPLPRAHPFIAVEVAVENKRVVDAWCTCNFFRGFEIILRDRDPRDAPYLTERICGICSATHATAASFALERAAGARPPRNGNLLRNLIHGADILQGHLRHFYLYALPDYVRVPEVAPFAPGHTSDCRLPEKTNAALVEHLFQAVQVSRQADEMGALLGGKTPYSHGLLAGGSSVPPTADIVMTLRYKLKRVNDFIENVMPDDAARLAEAYPDYFEIGRRPVNMLSFGLFPTDESDRERHFPPGVLVDGQKRPLDPGVITEDVTNSWYLGDDAPHPSLARTEPDREKQEAYSWAKAPRYGEESMEGGPLARRFLAGEGPARVSTLDRHLARVEEVRKIGRLMEQWLARLEPGEAVCTAFTPPEQGEGAGLVDGPRGPLGHWLRIKNGRIANYEIVTPTAWNLSPRDQRGGRGAAEEALIGAPVPDEEDPVAIGRVIRAFDVCTSCTAHVMIPGRPVRRLVIVP